MRSQFHGAHAEKLGSYRLLRRGHKGSSKAFPCPTRVQGAPVTWWRRPVLRIEFGAVTERADVRAGRLRLEGIKLGSC
jgi:hypothetical protein